MVISKRERYVGIITAAAVGLFAVDRLIATPLLSKREEVASQIMTQRTELERAQRLFKTASQMNRRWAQLAGSALKRDASEAESQVLNSVQTWAHDTGLNLQSLKPDRPEKEKDFYRITVRATGTGTMSQVGHFLWQLKTAAIPVRVSDVQLTSRKEGTDDLSIQIGISTIYLAPEPQHPAGTNSNATARGSE